MPIVIPKDIPACSILQGENIFVMPDVRAFRQDIRPIEICILNLMPTKIETETQLMRLLGNSPLQVKVTLLATETYQSKNTSKKHLDKFYNSFSEIKDKKFDGMIITGAPVETLGFEDVTYWNELTKIIDYTKNHVTSVMYICWGAQAGLFYNHGVGKEALLEKMFGVFPHKRTTNFDPLLKGVDEVFFIPHSRHTTIIESEVLSASDLEVLAHSKEAGIGIVKSKDNKNFYLTGHSEYDKDSLKNEYIRDLDKGLPIKKPKYYFKDDENKKVIMNWASTANLLFANWLNYYVYQVTPFDIENVK